MATKSLTPINMGGNEIQNAVVQNLAAAPSAPSPGQIYFDTTLHALGVYSGTGWLYFSLSSTASTGAVKYVGGWNASTNSPALASGVGTQGQYYIVTTAGATSLDGNASWNVGDWAVYNGTAWEYLDGSSHVTSVNGQTGAVTTVKKFVANVGAMTAGVGLAIAHGLGTADVQAQVVDASGNEVIVDVKVDATNITLTSSTAQAANALRVIAIG